MSYPTYRHLPNHVGTTLAVGQSRWSLRCYTAEGVSGFTIVAVEVDAHHRTLRRGFDGALRVDGTPPDAIEFLDEAHDWLEAVAQHEGWTHMLRADGWAA